MATEIAAAKTTRNFVADVVIVQREIQIPLECPHCQADLTTTEEDGALTLLVVGIDQVTEHGAIEIDGSDAPDVVVQEADGADTLAWQDFLCGECRKSVIDAPGTMHHTHANGMVTT